MNDNSKYFVGYIIFVNFHFMFQVMDTIKILALEIILCILSICGGKYIPLLNPIIHSTLFIDTKLKQCKDSCNVKILIKNLRVGHKLPEHDFKLIKFESILIESMFSCYLCVALTYYTYNTCSFPSNLVHSLIIKLYTNNDIADITHDMDTKNI